MIHWFLANQKRLSLERNSILQLRHSVDWLVGTEWQLSGGLCVDAVLHVHGHEYEVRLEYPALFPEVPPTVRPRNANGRWTSHQYGNDGPLCLEWGSDNWHPEVTGAQLLESAYKLLEAENPLGTARQADGVTVASRHALKQGQELRGRFGRFFASHSTIDYLSQLPSDRVATFKFSIAWRGESFLAVIHEVRIAISDKVTTWSDPTIPKYLRGSDDDALKHGIFFKSDVEPSLIEATDRIEGVSDLLTKSGHRGDLFNDEAALKALHIEGQPAAALVLDQNLKPYFWVVFKDGDTRSLAVVKSESDASVERTPRNLEGLSNRSIGIVGLGSVGSKIAVSLARLGVRQFYFIDYDIFLPENIARHTLDWNSVGDHKVAALRETINRLGVDFEVEISRAHLTGQESTALVSGTLDRLGQCDLIIDATAESGVFNLLSSVAATYEKPMVWLKVYGGGFGGMIARSRPTIDPPAQTMRAAYLDYCHNFPAPSMEDIRDYAAEDSSGNILAASDADTGVIANHAARFAADTLLGSDPSTYPYSMYLIGLAKWWVFEAPFATIPIATHHLMGEVVASPLTASDSAEEDDNGAFIVSLLEKRSEASSPP